METNRGVKLQWNEVLPYSKQWNLLALWCGDGGDGGELAVINNFMLDISGVATATCEYHGAGQSSDGYVTLGTLQHTII